MPDINNQSFTPDFSRELDIESLISAPLVAVSKANVVMAQGQTRFLLEYCFKKVEENYEPIMIRMALNKAVIVPPQEAEPGTPPRPASSPGVFPVIPADPGTPAKPATPETIQIQTTYFDLPLLTIIPLNSLAVDKICVDFDLEITATKSKISTPHNEAVRTITDEKPQLYGKISYDPNRNNNNDQKQLSSKLKVNINASSLPLPQGVLTIIDLYTKSITPSDSNAANK